MKQIAPLLLLPCLLAFSGQRPSDAWRPLFNGQNLDGWRQIAGQAIFAARSGAIEGSFVLHPENSFLRTEAEYGDFFLEFEVQMDSGLNSGVQIRSHSDPAYQQGRVHGLQIELDPSQRGFSGGLYDEARRGWLYPPELNPAAARSFRAGRWNQVRVEALGEHIRTWVNGIPCADLVDSIAERGFIALQVHGTGDAAQAGKAVRFRNLRIRSEGLSPSPGTDAYIVNLNPNELSPGEAAQGWQLLFDGQTSRGWRGAHRDSFPAQGWQILNGELRVLPSGGAEAQHGGDIVSLDSYSTFELSLEVNLAPGANSGLKYFVTEQYPTSGSAIGLEYQLLDDERHPDAKLGTGGNRTFASLYDLIPAHAGKPLRPPGQWNQVRLIVRGERLDRQPEQYRTLQQLFRGAYVEHWLNQRRVLSYERGTQAFAALVARSKYAAYEGFGNWPEGRILLQDHGDAVRFRSIKIRRL